MATGSISPFHPVGSVTVAASTTAAQASGLPPADSILVFNATAATAFVQIGAGTATATSTPVPAGGRQLFAAGPIVNTASVLLASGSGSVFVTAGNGTAY